MDQAKHCDNALQDKVDNPDFFIQQYFLACLADFSYYIESKGEAAVIDPIRDIGQYTNLAKSRGATIKYIFETHLHADFVSGHVEMAKATGATIVFGPEAEPNYQIKSAKDGESFPLGTIKIRVDHTPGHTMESSCFVIVHQDKDYCVFTGDTLFLGEVGRPDLAIKHGEVTAEMLAGILYDSLRNKIMKYNDEVIVYPGHGAGSSCGKSIGDGHCCTIGKQKQNNYALQPMTKEQFTKQVLDNMPKPPQYFFHDAAMNKNGPTDMSQIITKVMNKLTYQQVNDAVKNGAVIVDTRCSLKEGIILTALNVSFETSLVNFVGSLLKPDTQIIVVADEGQSQDTIVRLIRIGYDNILGYLEGGFAAYKNNGGAISDTVKLVSLDEFMAPKGDHVFLDVRSAGEWKDGIIPGALTFGLAELENNLDKIPKNKAVHVYCKFGGRAKMGMSVLLRNGFTNLVVTEEGGYQTLLDTNKLPK